MIGWRLVALIGFAFCQCRRLAASAIDKHHADGPPDGLSLLVGVVYVNVGTITALVMKVAFVETGLLPNRSVDEFRKERNG